MLKGSASREDVDMDNGYEGMKAGTGDVLQDLC
jgi:hypothetical protein